MVIGWYLNPDLQVNILLLHWLFVLNIGIQKQFYIIDDGQKKISSNGLSLRSPNVWESRRLITKEAQD